jgi:hypothetical protein
MPLDKFMENSEWQVASGEQGRESGSNTAYDQMTRLLPATRDSLARHA